MLTKNSGYTFVQPGKAEDDNLPSHTWTCTNRYSWFVSYRTRFSLILFNSERKYAVK